MSDPVIEAYKKDVDRGLLRECLKLTPSERFLRFDRFMRSLMELREAGERLIHLKRAAGRPKDFEIIAELEALREERLS